MPNFLQPNTNAYALNGYSFFRMKQLLASPGDIFESEQGAHAFALGPDSDISQVNIAYFDQQAPQTFLSKLTLTPQRAFESPIVAFNKTKTYAPSQVPGRLLIWPAEIYDSTFEPPGFNEDNDGLVREPPVIDIFQFFAPPASLSGVRADKTFYYDTLPFGSSQICYVLIPYYGRRYASIWLMNRSTAGHDLNMSVSGINFRQSEDPPDIVPLWLYSAGNENPEISNVRSTVVGSGFNAITQPTREVTNNGALLVPNADQNAGLFDYLMIELDGDGDPGNNPDASLRVVVSDQIGRTSL